MIVLDTHVLIWAVQDNPKLGGEAAALIDGQAREEGNLVPAICAWEIALVESRGRIALPGGAVDWLRAVFATPRFRITPLEPAIACSSVALAWPHRDPADRMIVATANHWRLPLLTADETILAYAAAGHVQAIDARA